MLKIASKWMTKYSYYPANENALFNESMTTIHFYDAKNIDTLIWPDNEEGLYAKNFLLPLIKNGAHHYIDNIRTEIKILKINNTVLPITINDGEYENSYVCSPHTYYIGYAQSSLDLIKNKLLKSFFTSLFKCLSKGFKQLKFNKVIVVNNWLLPTNLYPQLDQKWVANITLFLQKHYPHHAILFRSIDAHSNAGLYQELQNNHYKLVASRQIFFTNPQNQEIFETRIFKSDLRLLQSSGYEVLDHEQLTPSEIIRMLHLYQDVYIHKYSKLNPQLNRSYVKLALNHNVLKFKALRKDGVIDGIAGYFCRNGIMTCPFFGYDKTKPQHIGLYRLLSTVLMLEAKKLDHLFHQSAGASTYKKIRRAKDHMEYTAVFDKHLPLSRKIPWSFIKMLINTVGVFYMKKY